ncbi:competence protein CoiA [Prosthecodimorpha staleyi]|uniref:Competence protein CoiA n=1 Tax=Prosthecodimorpha staleyi TaxID=2840188 RepID=A0A947D0Q9_9HYPH|nr:competence protein CoiA family protein [Prosthecodimorpha staleyi]MBT9288219.1 hypothetical protein [Prosthecodimorpha staleyi]
MLVAERDGLLIDAAAARRHDGFVCPECGRALILRRGDLKVSHFAHLPPVECREARGETEAHHWAKAALRDAFLERRMEAEVERRLVGDPAERRTDLALALPGGGMVAIEIQRSDLTVAELRTRTASYMRASVPVLWVGLVDAALAERIAAGRPGAGQSPEGLFLDRLPLPAWARFAGRLAFGRGAWLDPATGALWIGRQEVARQFAAPFRRGDPETGFQDVGGRWSSMKTRVDLRLHGPVPLRDLIVRASRRRAARIGGMDLPAGPIAWFDTEDGLDGRIEAFTRGYRAARAAVLGRPGAAAPDRTRAGRPAP